MKPGVYGNPPCLPSKTHPWYKNWYEIPPPLRPANEHNPPIAVVNNQHVTGNLGATFAKYLGMEAKIEALEPRDSGALLFLA